MKDRIYRARWTIYPVLSGVVGFALAAVVNGF